MADGKISHLRPVHTVNHAQGYWRHTQGTPMLFLDLKRSAETLNYNLELYIASIDLPHRLVANNLQPLILIHLQSDLFLLIEEVKYWGICMYCIIETQSGWLEKQTIE
ncbi:predicted protein [Histoplasma mississippiense (nom. inval.)]|uniref:predicted protein n=1 Tax=Ajellomyces capsulatus (strain NAm1 / WU24) TaxID=2059318 RepID=UPI000157B2C9|nr:predicted protein [Histoplasma mississippiense (nom. inval.)]EDN02306.1 predicted protein [Histoplasma mississippiense (nom. inval.)]